jgi:hypothetical protein
LLGRWLCREVKEEEEGRAAEEKEGRAAEEEEEREK